jgi:hypothetical protein
LEKLGNYGDTSPRFSNALPSFELTEEPPHELPAFSSEQTIICMTNNETSLRFVSAPVSYNDPTYAGDQDTMEHAETLPSNNLGGPSTYIYTDSLKRRLTKCSSKYLIGISRLLRGLSISGTSATTTIRKPVKYDEATLLDRPRAFITLLDIKTSSTNATFPLPNTLLVIDHCMRRQGICIPSLKLHDSKSCWCAVAEELRSKAKL